MHRQLTLPALKAKKDVFVEWPLGRTLAEAEEMAALAKSMGVKTVVGLQARQAPGTRKVRNISTIVLWYDKALNCFFSRLEKSLNPVPWDGSSLLPWSHMIVPTTVSPKK